jgi:hypothetical protein
LHHLELVCWSLLVLVVSFAASHVVLAALMAPSAGCSTSTRIRVVVVLVLERLKRLAAASCLRCTVDRSLVLGGCVLGHRVRVIELADAEVALELLSGTREPAAVARREEAWMLQDMHLRHRCLSSSTKASRSHEVACTSKLMSD